METSQQTIYAVRCAFLDFLGCLRRVQLSSELFFVVNGERCNRDKRRKRNQLKNKEESTSLPCSVKPNYLQNAKKNNKERIPDHSTSHFSRSLNQGLFLATDCIPMAIGAATATCCANAGVCIEWFTGCAPLLGPACQSMKKPFSTICRHVAFGTSSFVPCWL